MSKQSAFTLRHVKSRLADVGYRITKRDGEYRVFCLGAKPGDGYFTDDLADALTTGLANARRSLLSSVVNRCIAEGSPVITEVPASKEFVVASISTKANAFGLHGIVLVAADGEAWEVGHCQCSPVGNAWSKGQRIIAPLVANLENRVPVFHGCEIPRRLQNCPLALVRDIFNNASR